jgi:hypothetical protein
MHNSKLNLGVASNYRYIFDDELCLLLTRQLLNSVQVAS